MEYLPPSGKFPAVTSHPGECPEPKPKKVRGINFAQRVDPEEVLIIWRVCDGCGAEWTVKRMSLASRREAFFGACCDGTHGEFAIYTGRPVKDARRLRAVA